MGTLDLVPNPFLGKSRDESFSLPLESHKLKAILKRSDHLEFRNRDTVEAFPALTIFESSMQEACLEGEVTQRVDGLGEIRMNRG